MIIKNTDKEYCPTCKKDVDYIMKEMCSTDSINIGSGKIEFRYTCLDSRCSECNGIIKAKLPLLFNLISYKERINRVIENYKENIRQENKNDLYRNDK